MIPNKQVTVEANRTSQIRELLDARYQGVKRLFVPAYNDTRGANRVTVDSNKKYYLPRLEIKNYNIEIDGRNFMISLLMM